MQAPGKPPPSNEKVSLSHSSVCRRHS